MDFDRSSDAASVDFGGSAESGSGVVVVGVGFQRFVPGEIFCYDLEPQGEVAAFDRSLAPYGRHRVSADLRSLMGEERAGRHCPRQNDEEDLRAEESSCDSPEHQNSCR